MRMDLTGQVYGRLTVLSMDPDSYYCSCQCECGNVKSVLYFSLTSGRTMSCGCYNKELRLQGKHHKTHSNEYKAWTNLKHRCLNPNSPKFKDYGARGIGISDEWIDFETFYKDMGDRPSNEYSIDRIDNDGPYSKDNCKWSTRKEQANNMRSNVLIPYSGEMVTLRELSDKTGIAYRTLQTRYYLGMTGDELIKPVRTSCDSTTHDHAKPEEQTA